MQAEEEKEAADLRLTRELVCQTSAYLRIRWERMETRWQRQTQLHREPRMEHSAQRVCEVLEALQSMPRTNMWQGEELEKERGWPNRFL